MYGAPPTQRRPRTPGPPTRTARTHTGHTDAPKEGDPPCLPRQLPSGVVAALRLLALVPMASSDGTMVLSSWKVTLDEFLQRTEVKKVQRIAFHVVRAAKKFLVGTGNAAWIMGTTALVMVMPLVFEIDREQQGLEWEANMGGMPKQ
jgi:import receptor subunit TOM22